LGCLRRTKRKAGQPSCFLGRGGLAPRAEDRPPSLLRGANYQGASRFLMASRLVIKKVRPAPGPYDPVRGRIVQSGSHHTGRSCSARPRRPGSGPAAAAAGRSSNRRNCTGGPCWGPRTWATRRSGLLGEGRESSLARTGRPNVQVSRVSARLAARPPPSQQDRVSSVPKRFWVRGSACLTRRRYLAERASGAWTSSPPLTGFRATSGDPPGRASPRRTLV
jgi:hypothetical protein